MNKHNALELWQQRELLLQNLSDTMDGSTLKFELTQLKEIDSAGLATLIAVIRFIKQKVQPNTIQLDMVGANQQLIDLAEISGINNLFPL